MPPKETRDNMRRARLGEIVFWSSEEKTRLQQVINCGILAKRYPNSQEGARFMNEIDYKWRDMLEIMAQELTNEIVFKWHKINATKDIAVVLFGSVAKGLVKRPDHPDPSNIDLSVIGNINIYERERLFDAIRPRRKEIQRRITANCSAIETGKPNPGNAGVSIQNIEKLKKDCYEPARRYVASNAYALYDPSGIWKEIETEALKWALVKPPKKR